MTEKTCLVVLHYDPEQCKNKGKFVYKPLQSAIEDMLKELKKKGVPMKFEEIHLRGRTDAIEIAEAKLSSSWQVCIPKEARGILLTKKGEKLHFYVDLKTFNVVMERG